MTAVVAERLVFLREGSMVNDYCCLFFLVRRNGWMCSQRAGGGWVSDRGEVWQAIYIVNHMSKGTKLAWSDGQSKVNKGTRFLNNPPSVYDCIRSKYSCMTSIRGCPNAFSFTSKIRKACRCLQHRAPKHQRFQRIRMFPATANQQDFRIFCRPWIIQK
jgi:hypothetical protein